VSWLTESFQANTVAWLLISTVFGGILGAAVKFLFEDFLRPWLGVRRETRRVTQRYAAPLVRSAEALERRINILVRNADKKWFATDEYIKLSTLYVFGEHLGWIRIIEREFGFLPFESSRRGRRLNERLNGIFRALTSHAYFRWHPEPDAVSESALPRLILTAIGEAMTSDSEPPRAVEFTEFVKLYANDAQFRRWFLEVERFLAAADPASPLRWDRLIAAGGNIRALIWFLDPKSVMVQRRAPANLELLSSPEVRATLTAEFEGHDRTRS
jgi:hypothetical protein